MLLINISQKAVPTKASAQERCGGEPENVVLAGIANRAVTRME